MNLTVERVRVATAAMPALYLVSDGTEDIGLLEKYNGGNHPWKAFGGSGCGVKYLGAWYSYQGGKESALKAIRIYNQYKLYQSP